MRREGAVLSWEDDGTEWIADWIADNQEEGGVVDTICPTCNQDYKMDAQKAAYEAWCDYGSQSEWEYFTEELTQLLDALNPDGSFHVEGHNMGWLHREGYKDVFLYGEHAPARYRDGRQAEDRGSAFLRAISPRTQCMYWIWAINALGEEFNPWAVKGEPCPFPPTSLVIEISEHDGISAYDVTPYKEEEEEEE